MIQKTIPVLPAVNIKDTIMFYEGKLGFKAINKGGYVVMKKDKAELHFFLCADKYVCENSCCCIIVADVECLFAELSALDIIDLKGKLTDKPGGIKEFIIKDNNGNMLRFAEQH
jgi:hypothetical protein